MNQNFGIDWPHLMAQLLSFIIFFGVPLILAIWATVVAARTFRGFLAPVWILLCWLLPVVGPIAALIAAKKQVALDEHPVVGG
jgi:hypothetical protein